MSTAYIRSSDSGHHAPHVLVIPSWYPRPENPAAGLFFRSQVQALNRSGLRVGVVAPDFQGLTTIAHGTWLNSSLVEDDNGVPTYRCSGLRWLPFVPGGNAALWVRAGLRLVGAYIRDHGQPDVIHAHCALYAGCLAEVVKRRYKIPYVLTEHSSYFGQHRLKRQLYRLEAKNAYRNADSVTVVSPALGELLRFEMRFKAHDWTWTPNMVEGEFAPDPSARRSHSRAFCFLNVAMMTEVKGQQDLLRAFAQSFHGKHDIELRIAGDGPEMPRLRALARSLGITEQVHFLGSLNRAGVRREMQSADAFVLSSRYETFGVVLIEALACGVPVIATACGGPECIVDQTNGILVAAKNPQHLAAGMLEMFLNVRKYDKEKLRRECLRRFGETQVMMQFTRIYSRVLESTSTVEN